jgi:predicted amidohydrolase YtcJ
MAKHAITLKQTVCQIKNQYILRFTRRSSIMGGMHGAVCAPEAECARRKRKESRMRRKESSVGKKERACQADWIFIRAAVWAGGASGSEASALAVRGGRIVAVGSDAEVMAHAGRGTEVEDLRGAFVMPGFLDSHTHAPGTALPDLYEVSLYACKTPEACLSAVRRFIRENPEADEVRGAGWSIAGFSDRELIHGPRRARLDEVSEALPIILRSYDGHAVWMNGAAFARYGITPRTPDPAGGVIERDPHTGALWGTLKEEAAKLLPPKAYSPQQMVRALKRYQARMHRYGVTGIMSIRGAGLGARAEDFARMEDEGELALRVRYAQEIDPECPVAGQVAALRELKARCDGGLFKVTAAKFFADGVVEGGTAFLNAPYAAKAGTGSDENNAAMWGLADLAAAYRAAHRAGFQLVTHSIGDAATRRVLNALRLAGAARWRDARPVIAHLQLVRPQDICRMRRLGVVASVQPFWHMKEPRWWSRVDALMLGMRRATREYPLRRLFDAGLTVASSSDHPVTVHPDPLVAIETGVTRNLAAAKWHGVKDIASGDSKRHLLGKGQRVSVERMLASYTRNSAFLMGCEDECGALSPGLAADFIVLDRDPRTVPPVEIETCRVLRTYFNGRMVWDGACEAW